MKLSKTLEKIKERPAMYLGEASLSALYFFVAGYDFALQTHEIEREKDDCIPGEFYDWIAYRLHFEESTSGWRNMLLNRYPDEAEALRMFFQHWEEFRVRKPHVVAVAEDANYCYRSVRYNQNGKSESRIIKYPSYIELVTYTEDPGFWVKAEEKDECDFYLCGFYPELSWVESFTRIRKEEWKVIDEERFT